MQQLETVPYLLYEPDDTGILWIRFNRPERMNAVVGGAERIGTLAKLGEYMRAGDDDPNARVIVLTGVGRAFCAGADTRGAPDTFARGDNFLGNRPVEGADRYRTGQYHGSGRLANDIARIKKPTIAMMNGPAAGIGTAIALQFDIRYGCESTRFIGHQHVGQCLKSEVYYLPRLVGLSRALEFAYTGSLDAQEAYEWGLLNKLVPSDQLEQAVRDLCARIVRNPPVAQWLNKRNILSAIDASLETANALTAATGAILDGSEDADEARRAFSAGRRPNFAGR